MNEESTRRGAIRQVKFLDNPRRCPSCADFAVTIACDVALLAGGLTAFRHSFGGCTMVAGQFPTTEWRDNPDGQVRTIQEAVQIARANGVLIPDDVEFHVDETGELHKDLTARAPRVDKPSGERVYWSDMVHDLTNKVPIRVWPGILRSDEAIVAVIAHEMHELGFLRQDLQGGGIMIDDLVLHTEPGRPGNVHCQAWDVADELVNRMRGGLAT